MAEHGKPVCTLGRNRASLCHDATDCAECRSCGWEQTELLRRKAAIRAVWKKPYMETRKYCLKLRKERKHD